MGRNGPMGFDASTRMETGKVLVAEAVEAVAAMAVTKEISRLLSFMNYRSRQREEADNFCR